MAEVISANVTRFPNGSVVSVEQFDDGSTVTTITKAPDGALPKLAPGTTIADLWPGATVKDYAP